MGHKKSSDHPHQKMVGEGQGERAYVAAQKAVAGYILKQEPMPADEILMWFQRIVASRS